MDYIIDADIFPSVNGNILKYNSLIDKLVEAVRNEITPQMNFTDVMKQFDLIIDAHIAEARLIESSIDIGMLRLLLLRIYDTINES